MLLTGTYSRSLDEKLRVAIPKPLRLALACPQGGALYVAPGTDESLVVYTEEAFAELARRLAQSSPTEGHVRAFTRLFYARAQRVALDRQGRIRIPAELAQLAGLRGTVILLGVQDHLELWAEQRWRTYLEEKRGQFDQIAEAAFRPVG
ncbi:MAG TPA: division/cell wall cluster transcriptional repressor MraZ [Planctomycetaceae bacterium]|nr:division/cell wall cluster transcriptional repressor MraZ [Planctomycetaceae bacterium]HIQ20420.1 division/cell wall cluster transcriptional repressor MraZ [Planctomycetota bacterium]